jgi:hypothetical protein
VTIDADALAALPSDPFDQEPPAPGTYAVAAWINTHGDGAGTPAARLARLANEARDLDGPALEGLQRLLDGAQWMQTPLHTGAVMEALQRATDK